MDPIIVALFICAGLLGLQLQNTRLEQHSFISSQFWNSEVQDQGVSSAGFS
jgi:hypothetical protein